MRRLAVFLALTLLACGEEPNQKTVERPLQSVPVEPRADCPDSRARLYGECLDQRKVLADALELAQAGGKTVLVSFGAEWCVWCHLLDRHLKGETFQSFDYTYEGETYSHKEPEQEADAEAARALGLYMSDNFVLAHVEADDKFKRQPEGGRGWDVIEEAQAESAFSNAVPFVFAVDAEGKFIAEYDIVQAEISDEARKYRGYDRRKLLALAQAIRREAEVRTE